MTDRATHGDKKRAPLEGLLKISVFIIELKFRKWEDRDALLVFHAFRGRVSENEFLRKMSPRAAFKDTFKSHRDPATMKVEYRCKCC